MSTQAIADYITKQIFIERNIVTYRSLSRQFSLHVNAAKNELATYHHDAPYKSQNSCATFLVCGAKKKDTYRDTYRNGEDVDMDQTQDSDNVGGWDGTEEDDSDEVSQTTVLLVNERDLEGAKCQYDVIDSIYLYSLAPAPLIDSALICDCTESVRSIDRSKGVEWAATVGRVVLSGIKTGPPRKGKLPVAPQAPVAGPSKLKPTPAPDAATTKLETMKADGKLKQTTSSASIADKPKDRINTGKLNFFTKAKDIKPPEGIKKVKKEESTVDLNQKLFFTKPTETTTRASSTRTEKESEKESGSGDHSKTRASENTLAAAKFSTSARRRVAVTSSDEEYEAPIKSARRTKSHASPKSDNSSSMDPEVEREARALMDLDDDQVERVSHAPSTAASELEDQSETDSLPTKTEQEDEDIDMADDSATRIRPKKRKAKAFIPVGKNGLKKRKVMKTKSRKDENGYIYKEDYTDWESVDDEEPEKKVKTKPKMLTVKKEATKEDERLPSATPEDATRKSAKPAASRAKAKASGKSKTQKGKGLMTFFGPSKKT